MKNKFLNFFQIDWSFLVLLALYFVLGKIKIYFIFVIFIILHEMFHFFIAWKHGYYPQKVKLNFFGASLEGLDDFSIKDEIAIVLAGPLFNFFIIIFCYLSFWFYPESYEFLSDVLYVNKSILFFNMLPIFPLDAGRLVLCVLSKKFDRYKALKIQKNISLVLIFFIFVVSFFSFFYCFNFSLGFVSVNLFILLFESANGTSFKRDVFFYKKIKRIRFGLPQKIVYVSYDMKDSSLLKFIDNNFYYVFVFVNENFNEINRIDECELLKRLGFI